MSNTPKRWPLWLRITLFTTYCGLLFTLMYFAATGIAASADKTEQLEQRLKQLESK